MEKIFNTFIIPSIGRKSLKASIESALKQSHYSTRVIVVFDNCRINKMVKDDRVIYLKSDKDVWGSGARNIGINYAVKNINSEFISFLDDDGVVLDNFNKVLSDHKQYELIIHSIKFPFHSANRRIIPLKSGKGIARGWMGIAMSVKTKILKNKNIRFIPKGAADFEFAKSLIDNGVNHYKTGILTYIALRLGGTGIHTGKKTKKNN